MVLNGHTVIGISLRQLLPSNTLALEQICENECECASPLDIPCQVKTKRAFFQSIMRVKSIYKFAP